MESRSSKSIQVADRDIFPESLSQGPAAGAADALAAEPGATVWTTTGETPHQRLCRWAVPVDGRRGAVHRVRARVFPGPEVTVVGLRLTVPGVGSVFVDRPVEPGRWQTVTVPFAVPEAHEQVEVFFYPATGGGDDDARPGRWCALTGITLTQDALPGRNGDRARRAPLIRKPRPKKRAPARPLRRKRNKLVRWIKRLARPNRPAPAIRRKRATIAPPIKAAVHRRLRRTPAKLRVLMRRAGLPDGGSPGDELVWLPPPPLPSQPPAPLPESTMAPDPEPPVPEPPVLKPPVLKPKPPEPKPETKQEPGPGPGPEWLDGDGTLIQSLRADAPPAGFEGRLAAEPGATVWTTTGEMPHQRLRYRTAPVDGRRGAVHRVRARVFPGPEVTVVGLRLTVPGIGSVFVDRPVEPGRWQTVTVPFVVPEAHERAVVFVYPATGGGDDDDRPGRWCALAGVTLTSDQEPAAVETPSTLPLPPPPEPKPEPEPEPEPELPAPEPSPLEPRIPEPKPEPQPPEPKPEPAAAPKQETGPERLDGDGTLIQSLRADAPPAGFEGRLAAEPGATVWTTTGEAPHQRLCCSAPPVDGRHGAVHRVRARVFPGPEVTAVGLRLTVPGIGSVFVDRPVEPGRWQTVTVPFAVPEAHERVIVFVYPATGGGDDDNRPGRWCALTGVTLTQDALPDQDRKRTRRGAPIRKGRTRMPVRMLARRAKRAAAPVPTARPDVRTGGLMSLTRRAHRLLRGLGKTAPKGAFRRKPPNPAPNRTARPQEGSSGDGLVWLRRIPVSEPPAPLPDPVARMDGEGAVPQSLRPDAGAAGFEKALEAEPQAMVWATTGETGFQRLRCRTVSVDGREGAVHRVCVRIFPGPGVTTIGVRLTVPGVGSTFHDRAVEPEVWQTVTVLFVVPVPHERAYAFLYPATGAGDDDGRPGLRSAVAGVTLDQDDAPAWVRPSGSPLPLPSPPPSTPPPSTPPSPAADRVRLSGDSFIPQSLRVDRCPAGFEDAAMAEPGATVWATTGSKPHQRLRCRTLPLAGLAGAVYRVRMRVFPGPGVTVVGVRLSIAQRASVYADAAVEWGMWQTIEICLVAPESHSELQLFVYPATSAADDDDRPGLHSILDAVELERASPAWRGMQALDGAYSKARSPGPVALPFWKGRVLFHSEHVNDGHWTADSIGIGKALLPGHPSQWCSPLVTLGRTPHQRVFRRIPYKGKPARCHVAFDILPGQVDTVVGVRITSGFVQNDWSEAREQTASGGRWQRLTFVFDLSHSISNLTVFLYPATPSYDKDARSGLTSVVRNVSVWVEHQPVPVRIARQARRLADAVRKRLAPEQIHLCTPSSDDLRPVEREFGLPKADFELLSAFWRPLCSPPPDSWRFPVAEHIRKAVLDGFAEDEALITGRWPSLDRRRRLMLYVMLRVHGSFASYVATVTLRERGTEWLLNNQGNCSHHSIRVALVLQALGLSVRLVTISFGKLVGHVTVSAHDPEDGTAYLLDATMNVFSFIEGASHHFIEEVRRWPQDKRKAFFNRPDALVLCPFWHRYVDMAHFTTGGSQFPLFTVSSFNRHHYEHRVGFYRTFFTVDIEAAQADGRFEEHIRDCGLEARMPSVLLRNWFRSVEARKPATRR